MYTFFGSAMTLAVGPVAVVSLLTGSVVVQKIPDYATNPIGAVNLAGELSLAVGVILTILSLFNCGNLVRYISHPVMSGFTSGAAMMIGLNQVKNAFGFSNSVPQAGQPNYDYNYQVMQFFIDNWYGKYSFTAAQIKKKPTNAILNGQYYSNSIATKVSYSLVNLNIIRSFIDLLGNIRAADNHSVFKSWLQKYSRAKEVVDLLVLESFRKLGSLYCYYHWCSSCCRYQTLQLFG